MQHPTVRLLSVALLAVSLSMFGAGGALAGIGASAPRQPIVRVDYTIVPCSPIDAPGGYGVCNLANCDVSYNAAGNPTCERTYKVTDTSFKIFYYNDCENGLTPDLVHI